jgi:hypothetical protein
LSRCPRDRRDRRQDRAAAVLGATPIGPKARRATWLTILMSKRWTSKPSRTELRSTPQFHTDDVRRRRQALWCRLDKLIADRPAYEMLPDRYDDPLCRPGGPDAGDDIF